MKSKNVKIILIIVAALFLFLILLLFVFLIDGKKEPTDNITGEVIDLRDEPDVSLEDTDKLDESEETNVPEEEKQEQGTKDSESTKEDKDTGKKKDNSSQSSQSKTEESSSDNSVVQDNTESPENNEGKGDNDSSSSSGDKKPEPSKPEPPVQEEDPYKQIADGKITCDSFGRYSGQYVEDGRDELVESVAAILVTNASNEYLEYSTLTFDINGEAANFIITGLPAGASAWVMEASKLVIEPGSSFTYQDSASSFRDDVVMSSDNIALEADGNMLTAANKSEKTLENVVVYYRVLHTDGNYLGGITYTANFDTLEPGASTEVLAGHYSADNCEVVRVSWTN